jgi:hypothetical protein
VNLFLNVGPIQINNSSMFIVFFILEKFTSGAM